MLLSTSLFIACDTSKPPPPDTDNDSKQAAPTQSTPPKLDDAKPDTLKFASPEQVSKLLAPYKKLDDYFRLMDDYGVEKELAEGVEALKRDPNTLKDVSALYDLLTEASKNQKHDPFAQARWRAVHLMGELEQAAANKTLFNIANEAMPMPEQVFEDRYSSEFRIRARAIDGLEKLKSIEKLTQIYKAKTVLSGVAAASLYELGAPPKGVKAVDAKKVLGMGDPVDFKVKKSDIKDEHKMLPKVDDIRSTQSAIIPSSSDSQ